MPPPLSVEQKEAILKCWERHSLSLLKYLRSYDAWQAEDVRQEVFCCLCEKPGALGSARNLEAWLKGVGRNLMYNRHKEAMRRRHLEFKLSSFAVTDPSDSPAQPDKATEGKIAFIQNAVPLTSIEQRVLGLRLLSQRTLMQVADELRLSPGTVATIWRRIINKCRKKKRLFINGSIPESVIKSNSD
jgi:RNA polymerase sigma factor (sigma-70 family)